MSRAAAAGIALCSLFAGCSHEEQVNPVPYGRSYAGTLSVDIRGAALAKITIRPDGALSVTLKPDEVAAAGLLDAGAELTLAGKVEPFPENGSELYTARSSLPPRSTSPCGDQPISLALALHRRGENARVGGALTAYCGQDRFAGIPARMLRLSGDLPKSP